MIKIKKSRAGWRVQYIGDNGEIVATSEVLKSHKNAYKNIWAIKKMFGVSPSEAVRVHDVDGEIVSI